jgi:AraC family transcriptional regulator, dual regulator of chb operon
MRHLTLDKTVSPGESFHISRNRMTSNSAYPLHSHDFCEIFFIEDGTGTHRVNGKRHTIETGALIMIRQSDTHGFQAMDSKGFVVANIAFESAVIDFIKKRYFHGDDAFFGGDEKMPRTVQVPDSVRQWLSAAFTTLASGPRTLFALERFLLNLFHELALVQDQPFAACPEWLTKAIAGFKDPEQFRDGTAAFARLCGHSPEHVSRVVKKCLTLTPTDLVNRARLDWAAGRLCLSSQKISSIAFDCGIENLGHFYRIFQKAYNTTPRTYRLRNSAVYR